MSTSKQAGIFIFGIGLLATVITGFKFVTREKVIDIGELEIMGDRIHELAWEPALGFAVMIAGSIVYVFGSLNKLNNHPTIFR